MMKNDSRPDIKWLINKPIAHRGLHGWKVPENSLKAYDMAIERGYNIELDVHIMADGELLVFHDNTLKRMFGENKEILDMTSEEIERYILPFVDEKIPTFQEVLDYIDGRTGLLIEIKTYIRSRVARKMSELLSAYKGNYAIQSFSPFPLIWYRRHMPNVAVGILASDAINFGIVYGRKIKPDFISYCVLDLDDRKVRYLRDRAPHLLAWTVTNPILERKARLHTDNIIFEGYDAPLEVKKPKVKKVAMPVSNAESTPSEQLPPTPDTE